MSYKITRFEESRGEVFVNIEVHDDLGMYNYGRWLSPELAEQVKKDFAAKKESATKYASRKTTPLGQWAVAKLPEARQCKLADIQAVEKIKLEEEPILRR